MQDDFAEMIAAVLKVEVTSKEYLELLAAALEVECAKLTVEIAEDSAKVRCKIAVYERMRGEFIKVWRQIHPLGPALRVIQGGQSTS